jgi:hypothetical protein
VVLPAGEGGPGADTALVDVGAGGGRVVKFAGGLEPAVEEPMAVAESEVPDSQVGCQLENLAALSSDSRAVIESSTTRTSVTMPYATPSARPMSSFGRRKAARGRGRRRARRRSCRPKSPTPRPAKKAQDLGAVILAAIGGADRARA